MALHLWRERRLSRNRQRVPKNLDELVAETELALSHAILTRQRAWSVLSDPLVSERERDVQTRRVDVMTADLAVLWPERRRLRLLMALRERSHESFLDAQGRSDYAERPRAASYGYKVS